MMNVLFIAKWLALCAFCFSVTNEQNCGEEMNLHKNDIYDAEVKGMCTYYYEELYTFKIYQSYYERTNNRIKSGPANDMLHFRYKSLCALSSRYAKRSSYDGMMCLSMQPRYVEGEFIWRGNDNRFLNVYRDKARVRSFQVDKLIEFEQERGINQSFSRRQRPGTWYIKNYHCKPNDGRSHRMYSTQAPVNNDYVPADCDDSLYEPLLLKYTSPLALQIDDNKVILELEIARNSYGEMWRTKMDDEDRYPFHGVMVKCNVSLDIFMT